MATHARRPHKYKRWEESNDEKPAKRPYTKTTARVTNQTAQSNANKPRTPIASTRARNPAVNAYSTRPILQTSSYTGPKSPTTSIPVTGQATNINGPLTMPYPPPVQPRTRVTTSAQRLAEANRLQASILQANRPIIAKAPPNLVQRAPIPNAGVSNGNTSTQNATRVPQSIQKLAATRISIPPRAPETPKIPIAPKPAKTLIPVKAKAPLKPKAARPRVAAKPLSRNTPSKSQANPQHSGNAVLSLANSVNSPNTINSMNSIPAAPGAATRVNSDTRRIVPEQAITRLYIRTNSRAPIKTPLTNVPSMEQLWQDHWVNFYNETRGIPIRPA